VYLELIKPVVQTSQNTTEVEEGDTTVVLEGATSVLSEEIRERRKCAQATLFTVLEQFLRLVLHCHCYWYLFPFILVVFFFFQ
jgi:hypothetical protein